MRSEPTIPSRRALLKLGGMGIGVIGASSLRAVASPSPELLTDPSALSVLSEHEASSLASICEALVPGAAAAGIVAYIDSQLAQSPEHNALMLQYLGVPHSEHRAFYQQAIRNIAALARARFEERPEALSREQRDALLAALAGDDTSDWVGPPASFVFFVLRADALDVVYGTPGGADKLGFAYRAHIVPERPW
jgi:hypothetical protein